MIEKLSTFSLLSSSKELPVQDLHLAKIRFSQKLFFYLMHQQSLFFYAGLSTSRASYVTISLGFGELTDHIC